MKALILSDAHADIWKSRGFGSPVRDYFAAAADAHEPDVVIFAGDLAHFGADRAGFMRDLKLSAAGAPVLFVPGNHDYYFGELSDEPIREECDAAGLIFAQKSETLIGDARVLTATLWTDFGLMGSHLTEHVARRVQMSLNDYRLIRLPGDPMQRRITTDHTFREHEDHLAWLEEKLGQVFDGKTLIVTHHGPLPQASLPIDDITGGFVSDLSGLIGRTRPTAWFFGHTHRPQHAFVNDTLVMNVGIGYPSELGKTREEIMSVVLRGAVDSAKDFRPDFLSSAKPENEP